MHVPFPSIKRCPKWTKISTSKIASHIVGWCSLLLLGEEIDASEWNIGKPNRETQLWALEMTLIDFQCDDKSIKARRNKDYT